MTRFRDSSDAPLRDVALIRAAVAASRAQRLQRERMADLFVVDAARLDERSRFAVRERLAGLISGIERDLRIGAAARLSNQGAADEAAAMIAPASSLLDLLTQAGVLMKEDLIAELIGDTGLELLAADLAASAGDGSDRPGDRPSLLVRLADCPEPVIAEAAAQLLIATNRTRDGVAHLSDPFRAQLSWWTAAALARDVDENTTKAIVEAAIELVGTTPPIGPISAAQALAQAIAARPAELVDLLSEALTDRLPELFVALIAETVALPTAEVCAAVLDRDAARLVVVLRGAGLERSAIAQIGVTLAHADPRRDLDRLADLIDAVAILSPADAMAALAPLGWPQPFRRAQRELEGRP